MQLQRDDPFARHERKIHELLNKFNDQNRVVEDQPEQNTFVSLLANGVGQVNTAQHSSQDLVQKMLTGEDVNQVEVFSSVQKADMSFRLLVQIRNKLMQAFEELNSIRV